MHTPNSDIFTPNAGSTRHSPPSRASGPTRGNQETRGTTSRISNGSRVSSSKPPTSTASVGRFDSPVLRILDPGGGRSPFKSQIFFENTPTALEDFSMHEISDHLNQNEDFDVSRGAVSRSGAQYSKPVFGGVPFTPLRGMKLSDSKAAPAYNDASVVGTSSGGSGVLVSGNRPKKPTLLSDGTKAYMPTGRPITQSVAVRPEQRPTSRLVDRVVEVWV